MASILWFLWALTGGALATWVMMLIWLPDPPPNVFGRFIMMFVVGVVGGLIGGYVVHRGLASSDPMPGIVAAGAAGLILSGAVGLLSGGRQR